MFDLLSLSSLELGEDFSRMIMGMAFHLVAHIDAAYVLTQGLALWCFEMSRIWEVVVWHGVLWDTCLPIMYTR